MTEQQAAELLAAVAAIQEALDVLVLMAQAAGLGVGILWGQLTWFLFNNGMRARHLLQ